MEEMLIATLSIRDKNLILLIKKSIIARLLNQQNTDSFRKLSQPELGPARQLRCIVGVFASRTARRRSLDG